MSENLNLYMQQGGAVQRSEISGGVRASTDIVSGLAAESWTACRRCADVQAEIKACYSSHCERRYRHA